MKDQDKTKEGLSELRRRAEVAAAEKSLGVSVVSALSPEKVQELIHELQVHQIELEMQNEELRQELEALRDKYSTFYDFAPIGYFTLDQNGVILDANLTTSGLLGRARGLLTGKPLASFVHEEDVSALYLHLRQVLETQSKQTCDVRVAKNDGSHIPVRLDSQVLGSQEGSPTVLRTSLTAITSRNRTEEALLAAEGRYRQIFDSVRYGILMVDFDTGKILDVNQYLIDMLGYSHEEFLDEYLWEVSSFKDTALNKDAFAELQQKGYIRHEDLPFKTNDGRSIDVEIVSNSYLVSGLTFLQCNIRDITERKRAEETTSRLAAIVESSEDAIIGKTLNGSIVSWNGGAANLYGYRAEEVVGQPISILLSPEQFDDLPDILIRIRRGEAVSHFETKRRTKDGRIVDVSLNVSPIKTQAGQIVGASTIARDMTERKMSKEDLLASEEKYRRIVENTQEVIYQTDMEGRLIFASPSSVRVLGYTPGEVLGRRLSEIYALPEERTRLLKLLTESGSVTDFESEFTRKDGSHVWVSTNARLLRDQSGNPIGVEGVTRDVTDRKTAEEALRKSEERTRLLIQSSPVGIGIVQNDKYAFANPALVTIMGASGPDEIVGESLLTFIVPEDRDLVRQRATHRLEGFDPPANYQVGGLKKNGERFDMSVWPKRLDYMGKPALLAFVANVTADNLLKAQLLQAQKMEAVGTLAGGIAHDFNNILQVVLGYSELVLADLDLPDRFRDDLGKVLLAGGSGADLVQRLLTFSRQTETKRLHLDLNPRIRQTQKFLQHTIPKMIDIELILAEDLARIYADPTQVDQVLMNLAVNARDAMPEGGKLVIETANVFLDEECGKVFLGAKPGEYVLMSMSDTGHGMDKETLGHIFEPFYTTKEAGKGTGLGLAMVYGIVHQHGGYITCYSEPGEGTTFKMYFPVIEMEMNPDVATTGIMPATGTETILLVDDEEFVRDLGKRILERSGYTVLTAANGKEALDLYKKERDKISLVILDLIMPEMGGKQCLEELLKIDPKARGLIASGFAANGQTKEALETGARGFVDKPYNMKGMLQAVREVLDSD